MNKFILILLILGVITYSQAYRADSLFSRQIFIDTIYTGNWIMSDFKDKEHLNCDSIFGLNREYQLYYDSLSDTLVLNLPNSRACDLIYSKIFERKAKYYFRNIFIEITFLSDSLSNWKFTKYNKSCEINFKKLIRRPWFSCE